jgi:hypothetical protein
VDLVLGEKLHRVGLERVLDVFLGETLHRVGLGEFMDVMIEDTLIGWDSERFWMW